MAALGVVSGVFAHCRSPLLFSALINAQMASLGFILSEYQIRSVKIDWNDSMRPYAAVLQDWPAERERSFLLKLRLVGNDYVRDGTAIYLYVPKDNAVNGLVPGNFICFYGKISKPDNEGAGFDYESYLMRHGVSGTLWVDSFHWKKMAIISNLGRVRYSIARMRRTIPERYTSWGLHDKALAVVLAVTAADRSLLGDEIKNSFSVAGTSHLLAVSGLHVGIMYAFLSFLIPVTGVPHLRFLKDIFVVSVLWVYSFFLGMPLSIVRSVIMFSVYPFARLSERDNSPINALSLAALLILLFDPSGIYDIGFQMSFLSVLSILIIQPGLSALINPRNIVLKYMWDIVSVSVAAQIGTAPLVVYLFGNFPVYFIIANLMAIPIMYIVVSGTIVLWLVSWIPMLRRIVVIILTALVDLLDKMLDTVSDMPGAGFHIAVNDPFAVCAIYAVVIMFCLFFKKGNIRYLLVAISVSVALCLIQTV